MTRTGGLCGTAASVMSVMCISGVGRGAGRNLGAGARLLISNMFACLWLVRLLESGASLHVHGNAAPAVASQGARVIASAHFFCGDCDDHRGKNRNAGRSIGHTRDAARRGRIGQGSADRASAPRC
ncbi:protein of unknown function [Pararobbsia alpina]